MLSLLRTMWDVFLHTFHRRVTVQYPEQKAYLAPRYRGRIILSRDPDGGERCVGCYLCAAVCPVDCIALQATEDEHGRRFPELFRINFSRCIFCGFCVGPQHPATHGTLRLVVRLDGERVISADPVIGYMHRGYEKLTEFRTYPQITTLINRIDWLSSFANEVPFIARRERLMDIEAPPRASTSARSSPSCPASRRSSCSSARWASR